MKIEQGLFKFDFTDYHAILGVALDADAKQIRKRYLKIARKLHPDSLSGATAEEKQKASELLSKMVNPAYEQLTQDKSAAEYKIVLKMQGQKLQQQANNLPLESDPAKELVKTSNVDAAYNNSLKVLAETQYKSLADVLSVTGQISELNMAYLARTAGVGGATAPAPPPPPAAAASSNGRSAPAAPPAAPTAPVSPKQHRVSIIERYLNRAKEFEAKQDYSRAILEMREAIQSNPNNAGCHSYLANLYLKANQSTMARIHVKRALEIDPKDNLAKLLEPRVSKTGSQSGKGSQKGGQGDAKSKGGGLFGLFGGKRK
ncbi:MAG: DnaJ domain-containing protein [Leptolyngbya sp.]|nr:DnaJ domain-containing protein [Leptolyngbya sp.]